MESVSILIYLELRNDKEILYFLVNTHIRQVSFHLASSQLLFRFYGTIQVAIQI